LQNNKKKFRDILTAIFVLQDYKDSSAVLWRKYIQDPLKSAESTNMKAASV